MSSSSASAVAPSSTLSAARASPPASETRWSKASSLSDTPPAGPSGPASPRSSSASARRTTVPTSSSVSASSRHTRIRERSAELTSKYGFSVVAPMSVTVPSSTCGSSASCWALLKRWISSRNSTLRVPWRFSRSCASAMVDRTSATPDMTADSDVKWAPISPASSRARLVLPVPGGPHRSSDDRWPRAMLRRSGPRSPTRCACPTNSSRFRGRIRAASGWRSGGGWKRASGRAPVVRRADGMRGW